MIRYRQIDARNTRLPRFFGETQVEEEEIEQVIERTSLIELSSRIPKNLVHTYIRYWFFFRSSLFECLPIANSIWLLGRKSRKRDSRMGIRWKMEPSGIPYSLYPGSSTVLPVTSWRPRIDDRIRLDFVHHVHLAVFADHRVILVDGG